ncbi:S1 family peptidase [Saccharicrinis fermentans]|uniref:Lipoprotein NlpI n=1 Tax=Saccharicrinis fermentans DSM 9555 = JCM 21142 TaxID=869213 RepID=W7Y286_9BACT|nr:serine protease [Saccharicrinis fermentans]GAF01638.1 lipoprotein NlpI [Saccharicrinis fermentans DSM 9555 = JCM 21142]
MRAILYHASICLLTLTLNTLAKAQNVLDKISKLEEAVFTITSYDKNAHEIRSRTGFFISNDGIALAPSSIFLDTDSISLTLRNGRTYRIAQMISSHEMANLSMFKVFDHRGKGFDYIIPSQSTENENNEVLIFSDPKEAQGGVSLGVVSQVFQAPYLNRLVKIDSDYGERSSGAPVINDTGELIGIAHFLKKGNMHLFASTHILNDTLWANHTTTKNWKTLKRQKDIELHSYMLDGISHFIHLQWVDAARDFTSYLKNDSTNVAAHILRGEARRRYENFIGMRLDYDYVKHLHPDHFLMHYYEALDHIRNKNDKEAFVSLIASIENYEYFSPALVEFGLLVIKLRNDIETAMKCYDQAIKTTPLYANGFYERSRLKIQYFDDKETAMEDISRAIQLNRRLPGAFTIRGTLQIQSENYLEAITDLDKALNIDPSDTHALFNRGLAYYNLGMKQKSCKDWDTAGQLGHYKSTKYLSRYCNKTPIRRSQR